MLKSILKLEGVHQLKRHEQKALNGSGDDCNSTNGNDCEPFNNPNYFNCLRTCAGSCSGSGHCYEQIK
jgi:hypothetical protein